MAIRIPILTSFDPKGLKQANAQFGKLQSSIGSLGRNFAAAGAVIAGAGAIIAKNAQSLARIEEINAQTAQTIKTMGNAAGISATEVETLAGSLEKLTATEAETIQEGANLLLTFGNIRNQLGAGNDIFSQTTKIMVDMGVALKRGPTQMATMLGKALNDPIRGLTALTRVGVSFTDEQREQVKALQQSGDLMGAQKVILAELQNQYGGSGAAFAQTFNGQRALMGHELGTIGEEATMAVMPALQGMVEQLREIIPLIGPQLKAAIESVDWKALVQSIVDFTKFLVENATTIANVIIGIFALNTAFKLMAVASGIAQTAIALKTWYMAQLATGMTAATIATGAFSTALKLIPFVAIAGGLALVITGMTEADSAYRRTTPVVTSFGESVLKTGHDSKWAATQYGVATNAVNNYKAAVSSMPTMPKISIPEVGAGRGIAGGFGAGATAAGAQTAINTGAKAAAAGVKKQTASLTATLKKEAKIAKKEAKLLGSGISEGLASKIIGSSTPIKDANKILKKIANTGGKAATKLQNQFNKTKAGQAELAGIAAEQQAAAEQAAAEAQQAADEWARQVEQGNQAAADAAREAAEQAQQIAEEAARQAREQAEEMQRIQEEARRAEEEALRERERVYESFLDSVKNTFGQIKDAIMGAFDISQLGGSTNSIIRNMKKLLETTKSFSQNIQKLSAMGLNANLLAQVIQAGPMAGAKLAASLVAGGAAGIGQISAGYSEFESLASGIAETGTNSRFGTAAQQNVYNINVNGGVGSGATIGKSIVDAIKAYERTSGAVWVGA